MKTRRVGIDLIGSDSFVLRVGRYNAFTVQITDLAIRSPLVDSRGLVVLAIDGILTLLLVLVALGEVQSLQWWSFLEVDLSGDRILLEGEGLAAVEGKSVGYLVPGEIDLKQVFFFSCKNYV